jgi:hypothetical protein
MSSNLPANPNNNAPAVPVSVDLLVGQYNNVNTACKSLNILSAEFAGGARYYHNPETGKTMLVGNGAFVVETPEALQVTIAKPGVPPIEAMRALEALPAYTQEQKGAYVGRSQAWASAHLIDEE